jgi:hypothetical protein
VLIKKEREMRMMSKSLGPDDRGQRGRPGHWLVVGVIGHHSGIQLYDPWGGRRSEGALLSYHPRSKERSSRIELWLLC